MTVPGFPTAFRGSDAVAAGLLDWGILHGAAFRKLLPDVYGARRESEPDLSLRSHAAYRWGRDHGVLCGLSAAELLGASCAPPGAPAEVAVPSGGLRSREGVTVRRDRLHPGEITEVQGIRVTTPLRTAFDLGCRLSLVEAVVAVDALARVHGFPPDLLLNFAVRYPRARGVRRLPEVLALADPKSGSPPETRLRLLLTRSGLPPPRVQHPVLDDDRLRAVWLDLAYPENRVGIEYEGGDHTRPERVLRDVGRYTRLVSAGWRIYRYTRFEIRDEPDRIVADIAAALSMTAGSAGEMTSMSLRSRRSTTTVISPCVPRPPEKAAPGGAPLRRGPTTVSGTRYTRRRARPGPGRARRGSCGSGGGSVLHR